MIDKKLAKPLLICFTLNEVILLSDTITIHTLWYYENGRLSSAPWFLDLQNPHWNWLRNTLMDTPIWSYNTNIWYTYIMGSVILWCFDVRHHFDIFGGWLSLEKICVTFSCGKMWKQNWILPMPQSYLPLSEIS